MIEERFTLNEIKFRDFFYSFIKYHLWFEDFARSRRSIPSYSERPRYTMADGSSGSEVDSFDKEVMLTSEEEIE